jgi:phosphate transport system permease protein
MLRFRILKDRLMRRFMQLSTIFGVLLLFVIGAGLLYKSFPLLHDHSIFNMLASDKWMPFKGQFGYYAYIVGTVWVTIIATCIAFPLCLLASIYLFEYASKPVKSAVVPLIDLLAGIPPVVYGLWGILVIVPYLADNLGPHFVEYTSGYSVLAGGIVLSIMIFPLLISLMGEVFNGVATDLREASLSLGATKWQTVKRVVVRKALPGVLAAGVLAVSRALGETIAVLMVCGNMAIIPKSVFDSCYPLPALIANNYGEMLSVPLYDSALMLAALILFVIIILFNAISRLMLNSMVKRFRL